jgi:two-component system sensor histidine kinase TctE
MKILRTDPGRFGIRARLLTLLLPAIIGLLALDSWHDRHAMAELVEDAYDRPLIESVIALRSSLAVGAGGALQLGSPALKQASSAPPPDSVSDSDSVAATAQPRYLHVSLTPQNAAASSSHTDGKTQAQAQMLLGEPDLPPPPNLSAAEAAGAALPTPIWYEASYRGERVRIVALRSALADGHGQIFNALIEAAESTGPRLGALQALHEQALLRDARLVLVVILLVWLGVTWSLRPLGRLRRRVMDSKGQALTPLPTHDVPHEVAPLVEAVNEHVAAHRDLLEQQSRFLADASHQLRTPLAIMMAQADVALREEDPSKLRETVRAMVTQMIRSKRLCEQLLSLAHAGEESAPASALEKVDLYAVATDVVLQYLALAHEKDQDLGLARGQGDAAGPDTHPAVCVNASGAELHEVLSNLVHNAIVHTPRGGQITVTVTVSGGQVQGQGLVQVRDNGPGIAPALRGEVFERFRQAETPAAGVQGEGLRRSGAQGAGLGLAIARAYARRNGGDITLEDAPGGGLQVVLRVPL